VLLAQWQLRRLALSIAVGVGTLWLMQVLAG